MASNVRVQAFALVAAAILALLAAGGALARAPDPGSIAAGVDGSAVVVSGTWDWPGAGKCENRAVGWALDWGDPSDRGNEVADGFSVGSANDNAVHTNGDCGEITTDNDRSGRWGPLSHTYPSAGVYRICAVTYEVHLLKNQPRDSEFLAGGSRHNKDNSVEEHPAGPRSPGCMSVTVGAAADISARKTVDRSSADPGDTLTYTIVLANRGGSAGSVDVSDDIAALLAHARVISADNGGSLSGAVVRWNNVVVPACGSTSLTLGLRLADSGWSRATTTLANTVVVPNTNCAAGSADDTCRRRPRSTLEPT